MTFSDNLPANAQTVTTICVATSSESPPVVGLYSEDPPSRSPLGELQPPTESENERCSTVEATNRGVKPENPGLHDTLSLHAEGARQIVLYSEDRPLDPRSVSYSLQLLGLSRHLVVTPYDCRGGDDNDSTSLPFSFRTSSCFCIAKTAFKEKRKRVGTIRVVARIVPQLNG